MEDGALERVIRPIVEGQIRGFVKEHPGVLKGVDWYKPRKDKATTFTNSLSKRIIRDLTCATTSARLAAALSGTPTGAPSISPVAGSTAANTGRVALALRVPWPQSKSEAVILLTAFFVLACLVGWLFRGVA